MMHKAWSSIEEVPYCFSRSSVKFQGHTALKIVEFHPNWAFPDCYSSLNAPMAMKCYTKLDTAKERCPIVFQGHPSNFKVTRDKTSPILTQIGRFRTIGRSQLSNLSDLPCCFTMPSSMQSSVKCKHSSTPGSLVTLSNSFLWYTTIKCRADSRFAPSQWERLLQSKAVSHWLGANLESALICVITDGWGIQRQWKLLVFTCQNLCDSAWFS